MGVERGVRRKAMRAVRRVRGRARGRGQLVEKGRRFGLGRCRDSFGLRAARFAQDDGVCRGRWGAARLLRIEGFRRLEQEGEDGGGG